MKSGFSAGSLTTVNSHRSSLCSDNSLVVIMIANFFQIVAVLSAFFGFALGAYEPDRITSLPGWNGNLPSPQYSGYLNVSTTHLHYWLVESENDPLHDPTVIWFNGGPGCSSMDGFVYEQGPFEISHDGSTLTLRPYRW